MSLTLTSTEIDRAAEALALARRSGAVIDCLPTGFEPRTLEDAYAIQDRLIQMLGWEIGGWFSACTNPEIQKLLGLSEPYYARLLKRDIKKSPAVLRQSDYPPMVVECEFAFLLKSDLPARSRPYTGEEVAAAVETVHPAIEVVAGHLKEWQKQSVFAVIADNGTDGALIYGQPIIEDWRSLDLPATEVHLYVNGKQARRGRGSNVLGDPLEAFVWLANALSKAGWGLKAKQVHNTGTATSIQTVAPGDRVVAEFIGLGSVEMSIL